MSNSSKQVKKNWKLKNGALGNARGRPKGAKDKIPRTVKENFDKVFEKLGGIEGFYKWAKKSARNMELFYTWYSKMLPTNVTGTVNANVKVLSFDFGENGE